MSFRLRVLALVMFIAVTATAATAWLTLQQATRQLGETVTAGQLQISHIVTRLGDHARSHAGWDGVAAEVAELSRLTGQRVRVTTASGAVLADSDVLAGGAPRATAGPPLLVDPRPTWQPARQVHPSSAVKLVWSAVDQYRFDLRYTACLTRAGAPTRLTPGVPGLPWRQATDDGDPRVRDCNLETKTQHRTGPPPAAFAAEIERCLTAGAAQADSCVGDEFTRAVSGFAPAPVQVYIGAAEDDPPQLAPGSIAATAGIVAAAAVGAAWLLSRRVLRPIGALTAASHRVGDGELAQRVPVTGRDELAALGRSFNRMADSLQRSEERQRRMIADVAHELRTPLANLRGYLEALKDGVLPADPELFASLHDEAVLQQRIVDDLQDLALAEAGALAYQMVRLDLTELLATCHTAHGAAAAAAGVRLAVAGAGPVRAYGDPDRLRQVVGNLVRNALAATPPGGSITLSSATVDGCPVLGVTDTGTGVAAADLPRLFDRFWRADPARTRGAGTGSGLGLAIAKQIVTDHGGVITATGELGVGTAFTIRLPAPERTLHDQPRDS